MESTFLLPAISSPPPRACFIVMNNVFAGLKKGRMKLDRQVLAYSSMHVEVVKSISSYSTSGRKDVSLSSHNFTGLII
jgi:hypothetical protein